MNNNVHDEETARDGDKNTCTICGRSFKTQQGYLYHVENRVCRKMECRTCQKRFKTSKGLNYHLEHTDCGIKKKIILIKRRTVTETTVPFEEITLENIKRDWDGYFVEILETGDLRKFIGDLFTTDFKDKYWSLYIHNQRDPYLYQYVSDSDKLKMRNKMEVVDEFITKVVGLFNQWIKELQTPPTGDQVKNIALLHRLANSKIITREKRGISHSLISALCNKKALIEDRFMKLGVLLK
jgi:hypothetical protein